MNSMNSEEKSDEQQQEPLNSDEESLTSNFIGQPGMSIINCRVCQTVIDVTDKLNDTFIKCDQCHEATPIKKPPTGKKFVRCTCKCLLICNTISQRVACPRCKEITVLSPLSTLSMEDIQRATCGNCHDMFLFNKKSSRLVRCPYCRHTTSVGRSYALTRGLLFLIFACIMLSVGAATLLFSDTKAPNHRSLYLLYAIEFLIAFGLFYRSLYFLCLKISYTQNSFDFSF